MKTALVFIAVLLVGCSVDPKTVGDTDNPQLKVEEMGSYKGCIFYRISDGGRYIHFMRCGAESQTSEMYSCGKGCEDEEVK